MFQRPFETILLASVLAVVACRELYADSLALWASQIQTLYWSDGTGLDLPDPTTYLATVAEIIILLSICVVHLIYEKPNWQMAGVYISSIFSILFGLAWIVAPGSCAFLLKVGRFPPSGSHILRFITHRLFTLGLSNNKDHDTFRCGPSGARIRRDSIPVASAALTDPPETSGWYPAVLFRLLRVGKIRICCGGAQEGAGRVRGDHRATRQTDARSSLVPH